MILKNLPGLLAIALSIISNIVFAEDIEPTTNQFISIADIHFTPFANCPASSKPCELINKLRSQDYKQWDSLFEKYGSHAISARYQDTNYPLLKSTLMELKGINDKLHAQFVLYLGDFLAHDFREQYRRYSQDRSQSGYQEFVRKNIAYLSYKFAEIFPNIDVYSVVGNNDSYSGDYRAKPHGDFFRDTALAWSMLIKNKNNQKNLRETFPTGGYYSVTLANEHHKIILLNTVLFSSHLPKTKILQAAALQELNWFHQQLQSALDQHQTVMLAFHIPVGVDVYATFKNRTGMIQDFWQSEYSNLFEKELKQFSKIITTIFCGHVHRNIFQLIAVKELADIPVSFTPSISPIFGNDPGFKVYEYDNETFNLKNFQTYSYSLANHSGWGD